MGCKTLNTKQKKRIPEKKVLNLVTRKKKKKRGGGGKNLKKKSVPESLQVNCDISLD